MNRTEVIKAIREECIFIRRVTDRSVASHFTINDVSLYLDEISKIEFSGLAISIYTKRDGNDCLAAHIMYCDIKRIGV